MNNNAYDLTLFEPLRPEEERKVLLQREKQKEKSTYRKNKVLIMRKSAMLIASMSLFFALNTFMILNKVEIHTLMQEQNAVSKEIKIVEAENVRIRSEIKARTSYESVIEFAEKKLGMVKADNSQITYIDTRTKGDQIIISGGKTYDKKR